MTRMFITTLIGMMLLAAVAVVFLSGANTDAFASTTLDGGLTAGERLLAQMTAAR